KQDRGAVEADDATAAERARRGQWTRGGRRLREIESRARLVPPFTHAALDEAQARGVVGIEPKVQVGQVRGFPKCHASDPEFVSPRAGLPGGLFGGTRRRSVAYAAQDREPLEREESEAAVPLDPGDA